MRYTYNELLPHPDQNDHHQKKKNLQAINAKEGVETRKLSSTVGGNINFCSHYGEQYGSSLKS